MSPLTNSPKHKGLVLYSKRRKELTRVNWIIQAFLLAGSRNISDALPFFPPDDIDNVKRVITVVRAQVNRSASSPNGHQFNLIPVSPGRFYPDVVVDNFRITSSRLKLAGGWRGGNSLNVSRNFAANCCAGTIRNACRNTQS